MRKQDSNSLPFIRITTTKDLNRQSKISPDHREHKLEKYIFDSKSTEGLTLTLTLLGMTKTVEE